MKILHTTPAQDGFYMPAEFAPHEGCLMIWPERGDSWQYGAYAARRAFIQVMADDRGKRKADRALLGGAV